jgi:hypothetical protein
VKVARTRARRCAFFFARRGTVVGEVVVVGAVVVDTMGAVVLVLVVDLGAELAIGAAAMGRFAGVAPTVNEPTAPATSAHDPAISAAVDHDFG